jgi:hypothetical protein
LLLFFYSSSNSSADVSVARIISSYGPDSLLSSPCCLIETELVENSLSVKPKCLNLSASLDLNVSFLKR